MVDTLVLGDVIDLILGAQQNVDYSVVEDTQSIAALFLSVTGVTEHERVRPSLIKVVVLRLYVLT